MSSDNTNTQTANSDQDLPLAAQIPLSSFILPTFPPEASNLKSLTLSCDIPLSEYSTQLSAPQDYNFTLPQTINSLTLELFSFGYPPGFLTGLAASLPNLRALTVYAQLFAGTTDESRADALAFFDGAGKNLRELCLVDAFSEKGFWAEAARRCGSGGGVQFLEVTFSYRHDEEGLKGVHGGDLVGFVGRNTMGCVLALHKPAQNEKDTDEEGNEEEAEDEMEDGILPFSNAEVLVERLIGSDKPENLAMLDTTLFNLTGQQLNRILNENKGIKVLSVSLEMGVSGLEDGILSDGEKLESLEIVVCPLQEVVENAKQGKEVGILEKDVLNMAKRYPQLMSLKASILRTRCVEWKKAGDEWEKAGREI